MNCIRCGRERGHGVVLVDVLDAHGGTYALCGACMREDTRIAPTARKPEKPPAKIMAGRREVRFD